MNIKIIGLITSMTFLLIFLTIFVYHTIYPTDSLNEFKENGWVETCNTYDNITIHEVEYVISDENNSYCVRGYYECNHMRAVRYESWNDGCMNVYNRCRQLLKTPNIVSFNNTVCIEWILVRTDLSEFEKLYESMSVIIEPSQWIYISEGTVSND